MLDRYSYKIDTPAAIRAKIGNRPRDRKVIMCHGVFDIVHPGHVRHLLYAKSKADILICSITADRFVHKGTNRPHVPQDVRAANLAAFECVDYVFADYYDEPLDAIRTIEPDFFAKGFEYSAASPRAATEREAAELRRYGGQMIFTPGDVVYSSTALLGLAPPSLRFAKLDAVMSRFGVTFDDLRRTLDGMKGKRVHVVGDLIVDAQVTATLLMGQPKTPTIGALVESQQFYVGGAGVVAKHIAAAGGLPELTTVIGDDEAGKFALRDLLDAGIETNARVDTSRPTVFKQVVVVDGYRVLKLDRVDNRAIGEEEAAYITRSLAQEKSDAVIFSDFRHGIFSARTIAPFVEAIPPNTFRAADSQVATRWGNILDFQFFDLITPNEREARFALGDQDSGIRPLVSELYDKSRCTGLLIMKMGERGVLACCGKDHTSLDSFIVLDSFCDEAVDAVGAGDALLAYSTLAMISGGDKATATILGNFAAGKKCAKAGNIPVSVEEMHGMLDAVQEAMS